MSTCLKHSTEIGCWNKADTTKENVVIHYTYATNASGVEIIKATRYTLSDGTVVNLANGEFVTVGGCALESPTISDRNICGRMTNGETWNLIERTTITDGIANVTYLDPDVSPMAVVNNFFAIIRGSSCQCGDEDVVIVTPTIPNISFSDTSPSSTAGSVTATISNNSGQNWTASSDQSWAVVSPTSGTGDGTFTVVLNENTTNSPRTVTITTIVNGVSYTQTITQAASSGSGNGTPANGALVSDNFQDGVGNAPFNLQIRNTTGNVTNWRAVISNRPYATIPSLIAGNYTLVTVNNGDGTYTHTITGTVPLGAYANITIQGGLPIPAGNGTGLSFFIL